jgi:N-acetylglucosaminyl-diphospho-decaprenol L-rhamnosyltransferase
MTARRASRIRVDAVVVAYNSARTLRGCVEALTAIDWVEVTVVDNASPDDSLETIADLPVGAVRAGRNGGFAAGCNIGIAQGRAPYVLLLNPDARIGRSDLDALVGALDEHPEVGLAAPRILEEDGSLAHSQRRFPRLRSTFAQALFLHRLFPHASWADELVRSPAAYERAGSPEWVSGACMLIRREALELLGGLDEDFFLYCEDIDLCARIRAAGWSIRYEPRATVRHEGGASGAREELFAVYARNRVLYARKHARRWTVPLEAMGVALGHATHAVTSVARPSVRRGHLRALAAVLRPAAVQLPGGGG